MITVKKNEIPHFMVNGEFYYIVGDQVPRIVLHDYMITNIDGDNVTLERVIEDE